MSEDLKLTEDGLRSLLHQRTGMQANSRRMNDVIKVFAELMAPNTRPIPLSQARGGEGVWVPKEPTEEMRKAGQVAADDKRHKWIGGYGERDRQSGLDGMSFFVDAAYRAMIAAAPSAGLGADAKRRPEVEAFADLMEAQLRANDHKPGWKADTDLDLYERLGQESAELLTALHRHAKRLSWGDGWVMETDTEQRIGREAADIANFAMMIADVCGALPTAPGLAPPAPDEEGGLAWLAENRNCELSFKYGDDGEPGAWQVHRVNGRINDREWTLIASGKTPAEALSRAALVEARGERE